MAVPMSFLYKPPTASIATKLHLVSSISTSPPPSTPFDLPIRRRRRRNSLRPKILTKPHSPPPNPKTLPTEPLDLDLAPPPAEESDATVAAVALPGYDVPLDLSGKSLARYGLYLIGVFVFQTVFAVWMLRSSSSDGKVESLGLDGSCSGSGSGSDKGMVSSNNVVELEDKINEIRVLARTARKNEKSVESVSDSRSKNEVERAVGNRLSRLRKSMDPGRDKLPGSYVDLLSEFGAVSGPKMGEESLMFKKKYKVRKYSVELGESPKGFRGLGRGDEVAEKEEVDGEEELSLSRNGRKKVEGPKGFGGSGKSKAAKGKKSTLRESEGNEASVKRKPGNGVIQEIRLKRSSDELAGLEASSDSRKENSRVFMKETHEIMVEPSESSRLSGNGSSGRTRLVKITKSRSKVPEKRLKNGSDMWWINLPYVVVILMHRDSEPKGLTRIYTLTIDTEDEDGDEDEDSYAVAFEDRGDATNFCVLLDSFFEDLGDVNTDVVPMTVKELQMATTDEMLKVIVVKKGQLRLYVGQPFEEVEWALRSLIEESQSDQ